LGVFVRSPAGFSISYEPGDTWNALGVSGLFGMLRDIRHHAPMSVFQMKSGHLSRKQRKKFEVTLREYLDEKI
ncbi:MAG: hypothetical protein ACPG7F_12155, partial [Aggregatilineales bacterium]